MKKEKVCIRTLGFTLFELLVSISIIAILVALGTVAYSNAQKKARDARRYQDMSNMQKTFEQYYASSATYEYGTCADMGSGVFTDPKNSGSYVYSPTLCNTYGYVICALLENATGNSSDAGSCDGSTCTYTSVTGGDYYCLVNAQ